MKVNLKFENKIPEDFIADNTEEKTEIIPQESKISENYILVDLTERDPPQKSWCYPKLYKTGALGKNLSWQISFDDDTKKLMIHHGYEDGSVVVKSVSLETKGGKTIYQQALQEAKHRLHQKSQVGYMTAYGMNLSDLPGVKQPMLAGKWVKGKTRLTFPIYIEPKINGIRMLSKNRKDGIECRTRKSKIYPFLSRIKIALRTLFSYLPEGSEIDGELYKHGMDLQDINSIVRKTVSPHPNEDCISYFMFDIILKDKIPF